MTVADIRSNIVDSIQAQLETRRAALMTLTMTYQAQTTEIKSEIKELESLLKVTADLSALKSPAKQHETPKAAPKATKVEASGDTKGHNRSQFIRDRLGMPAAEIVAEATRLGLKIKPNYVYMIKAAEKKKATQEPVKASVKASPAKDAPERRTIPQLITQILSNGPLATQEILKQLAATPEGSQNKDLPNYLATILSTKKDRFERISRGVYQLIQTAPDVVITPPTGGGPQVSVEAELQAVGLGTTETPVVQNPFHA